MQNRYMILLFGLLLTIQLTKSISNDFIDLFDQVKDEDNFNLTAVNEAIQYVDNKVIIGSGARSSYDVYISDILNEYAKKLFYGKLNNGNPEIQKALFFFKLAANYGNEESHYYLAFYSFYNLDGRFLFKNNFERIEKLDNQLKINNYIKSMNTSTLINSALFSSSRGYNLSTYLLGNLHLKGRGVPRSCEKAASYFKELGDKFLSFSTLQEGIDLEAYEKRRLDDLYFKGDPRFDTEVLEESLKELQYLSMSVALEKTPEIVNLAEIYYYGLRGEKKNFQKAFHYYQMAAERGDLKAKFEVAQMLVKGLGVQKDIKSGIRLLEELASKGDPRSQNSLGELHKYGEGVPKNETIALFYFKEAAKTNYSSALYNYGISLISEGRKEVEQAHDLISLAARLGHPIALFQLGLNLVSNKNIVGGCEVGAAMLKVALEKGPWSEKLKQGFYAYKKKMYKQAALYYMEAALLGQEVASVNAALIIDEFNVFEGSDFDTHTLQDQILQDSLWLALNKTYEYRLPKDAETILFRDLSTALHKLQYSQSKGIAVIQAITKPTPEIASKYRQNLIMKLLKLGAEDQDSLSLLVLGDAYSTGKLGPKNDEKAYEQYFQIISNPTADFTPMVTFQMMYNLGYMNHRGIGTKKNLTQAIKFYGMSHQIGKANSYLSFFSMKLAEWENLYSQVSSSSEELNENIYSSVLRVFGKIIEKFEEMHAKKIMIATLTIAITLLVFAKIRLENFLMNNLNNLSRDKIR